LPERIARKLKLGIILLAGLIAAACNPQEGGHFGLAPCTSLAGSG
jgi:hypothetical protein